MPSPTNDEGLHYIETNQSISIENQKTGFYMMRTRVLNGQYLLNICAKYLFTAK